MVGNINLRPTQLPEAEEDPIHAAVMEIAGVEGVVVLKEDAATPTARNQEVQAARLVVKSAQEPITLL